MPYLDLATVITEKKLGCHSLVLNEQGLLVLLDGCARVKKVAKASRICLGNLFLTLEIFLQNIRIQSAMNTHQKSDKILKKNVPN